MKTEEEIKAAAKREAAELKNPTSQTTFYSGFIHGYKQALSDIQEEKQKGVEGIKTLYYSAAVRGDFQNETDLIDIDAVFDFFLPYLQPAQESDAVAFSEWMISLYASNPLVIEVMNPELLYQEFKLNHKK